MPTLLQKPPQTICPSHAPLILELLKKNTKKKNCLTCQRFDVKCKCLSWIKSSGSLSFSVSSVPSTTSDSPTFSSWFMSTSAFGLSSFNLTDECAPHVQIFAFPSHRLKKAVFFGNTDSQCLNLHYLIGLLTEDNRRQQLTFSVVSASRSSPFSWLTCGFVCLLNKNRLIATARRHDNVPASSLHISLLFVLLFIRLLQFRWPMQIQFKVRCL